MRTSPTAQRPRPVARGRARPRGAGLAVVLGVVAGLASACGESPRPAPRPAASAEGMRFEETAEAAGLRFRMAFLPGEQGERFKINLYDHGCGVAVADVDGDGDEDVYFCNQLGPNALFLNDGHAHFTDVTARAGVGLGDRVCVGATFGDLDGDGDLDLYVTSTRGGNVLFRNRGDATFEDVTRAAGLELVAHAQQPACFDADGDGDLDLFVPCTAGWTTQDRDPAGRYYTGVATIDAIRYSPLEHDRFYRNRGDGVFVDATAEAGFAATGWGSDPAVLDFDGDGDLDLYVARMFGRCTLYRNDGRGHFEDVTLATLHRTPGGAVGAKVFDADGDGRLDLYTVDMHSDMWMAPSFDPASKPESFRRPIAPPDPGKAPTPFELRPDEIVNGNTLHVARDGGRFEDLTLVMGAETLWPWGIAVADFDADGYEDVFLPSGMGYPFVYWRSPLFRNANGLRFEDVTKAVGLDPPPGGPDLPEPIGGKPAPRSHRSAATADFDGDGRVDLVANPFNDRAFLYLNRSPPRSWVGFRLEDDGRVKAAVGAVVRVTVGRRTLVRMVQAAGGYLAQSSQVLHFGLGGATKLDRVEVVWPRGRKQVLTDVEPGRVHTLRPPR